MLARIPKGSDRHDDLRKAGRMILQKIPERPGRQSSSGPFSAADKRRDAHEKIVLGGLIVKFGLRDADRAFLMGGLDALSAIPPGSDRHQAIIQAGRTALDRDDPISSNP